MDATEFVERFTRIAGEMGNTLPAIWEQSVGILVAYIECQHGDDTGLDPIGIVDVNDIGAGGFDVAVRMLRGAGAPADDAFVLIRSTLVHMDDPSDLDISPDVLLVTNRHARGWMLFHVTLTGVTHHHLNIDGELRPLANPMPSAVHPHLHQHLIDLLVP